MDRENKCRVPPVPGSRGRKAEYNVKQGALKGLRVVDFGQYVAGPLAAMILGDYGADVVHIDPPGGPVWDAGSAGAVLQRGKRSIILDLKNEADLAVAKKLVDTADVLVENFRPGVMDRLGLGWEVCRARNPMLIYCSLPGFSADDAARRDLPGWEGIVESEAGIYETRGGGGIRFQSLPLASVYAGVIACHSITAALIAREKCGQGQHVESSLYDACFEAHSTSTSDPHWPMKPAPSYRFYSNLMHAMAACPCADGRYIHTTPPPRGAQKLCETLFPADWLTKPIDGEMQAKIADMMRTKTAAEWEQFCQECGAGVAVALTSEEWLHEASALQSRTVVELSDPLLGATRQPGVPALMLGTGDCAGTEPRHLPDADRAEILAELETRTPPVPNAVCVPPEPPLKGIKVLDLSQVVAGPTCGRLLAEYGAEVLKINNPDTGANFTALAGHETQNNGKKTVFFNFKDPKTAAVLDTLVRECDVFNCNFAQTAYERLGFAEEQLRAKNPGIIVSQINLHSVGGSREWMRGHEDLGECVSGMACRYSGSVKPEIFPLLVLDHMTGHAAALGVLLALYHRMRTGEGQRLQVCLSRSGTVAQIPYMLSYDGKVWDEPAGPAAKGWSHLDRMYESADGVNFWLRADSFAALSAVPGLENAVDESALEQCFAAREWSAWEAALAVPGVLARRCRLCGAEACSEDYLRERGMVRTEEHPGMGLMRTVHCGPRLSLTPPRPGFPVAAPGMDTESFLVEFYEQHPEMK